MEAHLRPILPKDSSSSTPSASKPDTSIKESRRRRPEGNVSLACRGCRARKRRCDGQNPCSTCIFINKECIYGVSDARRRKFKEAKEQALQAKIDKLQAAMDVLKFSSHDEAHQALDQLRAMVQDARTEVDEDEDHELQSDQPRLEEPSLEILLMDTDKRQSDSTSTDSTKTIIATFTPQALPSEWMVRKGSIFYFEVISGLFYVTASEDFDSLLDSVYRSENQPEMTAIAEVCAVASVGAHFHPDGVQTEIKDALFRTAIQNINELIEVSGVRAIGVLACLSIYGLLDKRRSTRGLIHLGLQLARWELQEIGGSTGLRLMRKKLHRTMIFLECWLSTSLGYFPELSDNEVEPYLKPLDESDNSDSTQTKMCQVGWLKAQVVKAVFARPFPDFSAIESLMAELEAWPQNLPGYMTLQSLIENKDDVLYPLTAAHNGALFLAHGMYLGAEIFLHRPILVAMADSKSGKDWLLSHIPAVEAQRCYDRCVEAARTVARLFSLLRFGTSESKMHNRCWLSNFEIFTACSVLLYDIAERLAPHTQPNSDTEEDLRRAEECITMLNASATIDRVSRKLHDTLDDTYRKLKMLNDKTSETSRSPKSGGEEPNHSEQRADDKAKQDEAVAVEALVMMAAILKNPFGHGDKEGPTLDFSMMGEETSDWFSSG